MPGHHHHRGRQPRVRRRHRQRHLHHDTDSQVRVQRGVHPPGHEPHHRLLRHRQHRLWRLHALPHLRRRAHRRSYQHNSRSQLGGPSVLFNHQHSVREQQLYRHQRHPAEPHIPHDAAHVQRRAARQRRVRQDGHHHPRLHHAHVLQGRHRRLGAGRAVRLWLHPHGLRGQRHLLHGHLQGWRRQRRQHHHGQVLHGRRRLRASGRHPHRHGHLRHRGPAQVLQVPGHQLRANGRHLHHPECRDDTKCKHTYTCDLTTFATLFVVPTVSATIHATTASRRCNSTAFGINPILTWSNTSPIFGTPTTANLTFGLVGTCALTPVFINGSPGGGTGVIFNSPWIPGNPSTCNISVLVTHECRSLTVYRNVPITCCGDGVLQSGSGETCDAGVLVNSNNPGSCCSTICASTPPVMSSNPLTVPQICSETNQPNISLATFFNLTITAGYSITSYTVINSPGCYVPFNLDLVNGIFRFYQIAQTCNLTLRATSNCGTTIDVTRSIAVTDCCGNSVFDLGAGETCENPEEIGYVSNGTCCTLGCKTNATDPASIMYPQLCDGPGDCLEVPSGMGPVDISCPDGWCVFKPVPYQPPGGGCTYYSDCPVVSCWDRACNSSGFCNYGSSYVNNLFVVELYKCYTGDVCQGDTYCTGDGALAYDDVTFSLPVVGTQTVRLTTFPTVIDLAAVVAVVTNNENSFGGPPAYVYTVVPTNVCGYPTSIVSGTSPTLTFTAQYSGSGTVNCAYNITVLSPCDSSTASRSYTFLASSCGDGAVQAGQGETCDIGALNGDPSECCNSTCMLTPGVVCEPSSDSCMNDAVCHAGSGLCPSNPFTTAGTQCFTAPADSQCSTNRTCSGVDYSCPNPYFPNGTVCHNNSNWCSDDTCDGVSSDCLLGPEIVYDDGLFCNGNETCNTTTGLEIPGTPVDCDDGDSCFTDACDEGLDACTHTPVPSSVGPCGTSDVGACEFGNYSCDGTGPSPNITCVGAIEPDIEVCLPAGIDENCNGLVDELCTEQLCINVTDNHNITLAACQNVTCNTTINQCYVSNFPVGTPCNDNVNCTENDECKIDFTCSGDPIVCPDGGNTCLFAYCEDNRPVRRKRYCVRG